MVLGGDKEIKKKINIRGIGKPPYTSYRLTNSVISRVSAVRWSEITTLQPSYNFRNKSKI